MGGRKTRERREEAGDEDETDQWRGTGCWGEEARPSKHAPHCGPCSAPGWALHVYQFSSVTHLCPALCDPMNCSTPGLPVHHQLPELA